MYRTASLRCMLFCSVFQTNQNVLTYHNTNWQYCGSIVCLIVSSLPQTQHNLENNLSLWFLLIKTTEMETSPMWCNHFKRSHHASFCKSGGSQQYAASVQTQHNHFFVDEWYENNFTLFSWGSNSYCNAYSLTNCTTFQCCSFDQFCLKRECCIHCR